MTDEGTSTPVATAGQLTARSPRTDLRPVCDACEAVDAVGFVAVGDRFDDDLRYLTRFSGPDRAFALVVLPTQQTGRDADRDDSERDRNDDRKRDRNDDRKRDRNDHSERDRNEANTHHESASCGRAVLCAPALFREQAKREFIEHARESEGSVHDGVKRVVSNTNVGDSAGSRAAAVLRDVAVEPAANSPTADGPPDPADSKPTILVPRSIPHDAAVILENAGYTLTSTTAVADARQVKTDREIDCLRAVQTAAVSGMASAETVLAACHVVNGDADHERTLAWNDDSLTTNRLRRVIDATLAEHGVSDAGNTVVAAGQQAADLHYRGTDPIRPGETILIDISPRGPHGYYGDLTRTFVVDGDGGWERRAYVAVEAARTAALQTIEPGATAATIHQEAAAELAAYGFDPNAVEGQPGFTHGTGHGVGMSLHEGPSLQRDTTLRPGHVITVEPGVYDPEIGGVRLEDLIVVTDEGFELLATYPFRTVPTRRTDKID